MMSSTTAFAMQKAKFWKGSVIGFSLQLSLRGAYLTLLFGLRMINLRGVK